MSNRKSSSNRNTSVDRPGRRGFLKAISYTVAGSMIATKAVAQTQAPTSYGVRDTIMGVGSSGGKVMCDRLASAWVAFAKTGDPNNPKIPQWPAYDATTRATMIFDTDTRVENDPRGEIRKFRAQMPAAASPRG
ncbi:MAG: hypothetical protein WBV94_34540 [Blastocatellia bacterium]